MINQKIKPIIFIDSGIGGLPYLQSAMSEYPQEFYIYIADSMNFPYGEKTDFQLRIILTKLALSIQNLFDPKVFVISCNTATLVGFNLIKELFTCSVVGIQPKIQDFKNCPQDFPIAILATQTSITELLKNSEYIKNPNIFLFSANILANFVENSWIYSSDHERRIIIEPFIQKIKQHHIRTLVLSCTHFVYFKKTFQYLLPHLQIIDYLGPNTEKVGESICLQSNCTNTSNSILYQTQDCKHSHYCRTANYFNLIYGGIL